MSRGIASATTRSGGHESDSGRVAAAGRGVLPGRISTAKSARGLSTPIPAGRVLHSTATRRLPAATTGRLSAARSTRQLLRATRGLPPTGRLQPAGRVPAAGGLPRRARGLSASAAGGSAPAGPPPKKSRAMIIGIVAAAVVLLAAIGGVILVLTQGGDTQPDATITPGTPTAEPTTEAPSAQPTSANPSGKPSTPLQPTQPTEAPNPVPSGKAITLDHGISVTPADGYQLEKSGHRVRPSQQRRPALPGAGYCGRPGYQSGTAM